MYFDLTDEQKAVRESLDALLRDRLDEQRLLQLFDSGKLDADLWRSLMDLGLGSILVPSQQQGLGLDLLTLAVVADSLGYHGVPAPVVNNALAAWLIACAGDQSQCSRWVAALAGGKAIAAFALLEPGRGWLQDDWTLAGPRISGVKTCVEWGADAGLLIVGMANGQLGLVETTVPGVRVTPFESLDRTRPLAEVTFDDVEATLLPGEGVVDRLIDALLILLAADACGAAGRAYGMAVEYARARSQFGQIIGRFQAVKHQLSNMAIDMEPCRPLHWYAAHAWDALPDNRARAAATAKAHITEVAVKTARAAVEAHGGIGYTWEYPLHVFLKRTMFARVAMGAPPLHRERMALLAGW